MLPKEHRLRSSRDFGVVFAHARTYVDTLFILKVLRTSGEKSSRIGFSTSTKLGKAVIRNRAKRRLREAVRLLGDRLRQKGFDAVLIARPPIRDANMDDIKRAVDVLFRKAGVLENQAMSD